MTTEMRGCSIDAIIAAIPDTIFVRRDDPASPADPAPGAVVVSDLTHDSMVVEAGWGFVCVPGSVVDGHDFAAAAVRQGAVVLIVERPLDLPVTQLVVTDARQAMGHAAAAVHGYPATEVDLVGITGTNGKTTVTHLLAAILRANGRRVHEIGTLSGVRTTPEATDLQRTLRRVVDDGVDAVAMEVSSHALALHRVAGCHFDVGVFTNLGRDHLDLHGSMEAYFRAKASLFEPDRCDIGVINVSDASGSLLADAATIDVRPFRDDDASSPVVDTGELRFGWRDVDVVVPVGGRFNLSNSLAALETAVAIGLSPQQAADGIAVTPPIPGRLELVSTAADDIDVVVDYAHTPDGVTALIDTLRDTRRDNESKVIIVLGCGGERDVEKRPQMGAAASAADLAVITSDNPRREDPDAIIAAMVDGVDDRSRPSLIVEPDRRLAIRAAIDAASPGDVVAIAGKGHETTQTIGSESHPFDDRVESRACLARRRDAGDHTPGAPS